MAAQEGQQANHGAAAQAATALARVAADLEAVAGRAAREALRAVEAGAEPNHVTALERAANDAARLASRLRRAQITLPQQRLFDAEPEVEEQLPGFSDRTAED